MIKKGKVLEFYKWTYEGEEVTVVGERSTIGGSLKFSFYIGKTPIESNLDNGAQQATVTVGDSGNINYEEHTVVVSHHLEPIFLGELAQLRGFA